MDTSNGNYLQRLGFSKKDAQFQSAFARHAEEVKKKLGKFGYLGVELWVKKGKPDEPYAAIAQYHWESRAKFLEAVKTKEFKESLASAQRIDPKMKRQNIPSIDGTFKKAYFAVDHKE